MTLISYWTPLPNPSGRPPARRSRGERSVVASSYYNTMTHITSLFLGFCFVFNFQMSHVFPLFFMVSGRVVVLQYHGPHCIFFVKCYFIFVFLVDLFSSLLVLHSSWSVVASSHPVTYNDPHYVFVSFAFSFCLFSYYDHFIFIFPVFNLFWSVVASSYQVKYNGPHYFFFALFPFLLLCI